MGCRAEPDEQVKALAESCIAELERTAAPKWVYRRESLAVFDDLVQMGPLEVHSESLSGHLSGCTEVILFAATLGTTVDLLLRRCQIASVGRGAAMQAAAAAMIEAFCDECQLELEKTAGLYLRPRFSPGYGDLPLEFQKPLLRFLETDRRIGLTVTDSLIMVPTKSVSAIIGLTPDRQSCRIHKCASCPKTDCPFRSV